MINFKERLKGAALGLGLGLSLVAAAAMAQAVLNPVTPLSGGAAVSATNPGPVTIADGAGSGNLAGVTAASTAPVATQKSEVVALNPNSPGIIALGQTTKANSIPTTLASDQPFQVPPTQTTAIATGTTGAVTATLAATASVTNYLCTVDVSATGGTAAIGPITITGLLGGTFTYQFFSTATGANFQRTFTPCVPASAVNTAIAVATTADGTASAVDVNLSGFRQ